MSRLDTLTIYAWVVGVIYTILLYPRTLQVVALLFRSGPTDNHKGRLVIDLLVFAAVLGFVLGTATGWLR